MRAAYIEEPGPAEAIRYGELSLPVVGERDVLVQVRAVAVNAVDTYLRSGAFRMNLPRPFIIGRDMCGVVAAVGSKVGRFRPGDAVWANNQGIHGRQGTFAEYLAIDEALLYPLPAGADPVQAVALVHSALTAIMGLFGKARLSAGETLFINGGSGNVGMVGLQLARAVGARVAVTAGQQAKADWCRQLGADRVIDYKHEDVKAALWDFSPEGVDVYWDATRRLDLEQALDVLAPHGRVLVMAGLQHQCAFPVGPFYTRCCTLYGYTVTSASIEELAACARQINGWLASGRIRARIHQVLPLSQAAQAHHMQEQEDLFGKVVLTMET